MAEDFAEMPTSELVSQTRAETSSLSTQRDALTATQQRLGRRFAELNRRGWTFAAIEQDFGVPMNTAWRWAQEFLP